MENAQPWIVVDSAQSSENFRELGFRHSIPILTVIEGLVQKIQAVLASCRNPACPQNEVRTRLNDLNIFKLYIRIRKTMENATTNQRLESNGVNENWFLGWQGWHRNLRTWG